MKFKFGIVLFSTHQRVFITISIALSCYEITQQKNFQWRENVLFCECFRRTQWLFYHRQCVDWNLLVMMDESYGVYRHIGRFFKWKNVLLRTCWMCSRKIFLFEFHFLRDFAPLRIVHKILLLRIVSDGIKEKLQVSRQGLKSI